MARTIKAGVCTKQGHSRSLLIGFKIFQKHARLAGVAATTGIVFATPTFAQNAEAVGTGVGLVIGVLIAVVVGAVVGWVASLIVKGSGSGLLTDILVGIGGSILASFLLPAIGIQLGGGVIGSFIAAVIGAVILLLIIKLIRKG